MISILYKLLFIYLILYKLLFIYLSILLCSNQWIFFVGLSSELKSTNSLFLNVQTVCVASTQFGRNFDLANVEMQNNNTNWEHSHESELPKKKHAVILNFKCAPFRIASFWGIIRRRSRRFIQITCYWIQSSGW